MNLGAHMSIAGSVDRAIDRAKETGCNAVQIFVKSPNRWRFRRFSKEEIISFREKSSTMTKNYLVAHSSYLLNLASPDEKILSRSIAGFVDEVERTAAIGIPFIVFHPGSHRGSGLKAGIRRISSSLKEVLSSTKGLKVKILLENTAGQGDTIGSSFEELAEIIDRTGAPERLGVCFDTCHAFAAGYDIRTEKSYGATFRAFDEIIGLTNLRVFHLNDSLKPLASRVDRHTHIGKGEIGLDGFSLLVNDEMFKNRPMILETPKGDGAKMDIVNLKVLRRLRTTRWRKRRNGKSNR